MSGIAATNEAISIVGCDLRACSSATALALLKLGLVEQFDGDIARFVPNLGIEANESADGLIDAVHLHSKGHEGFEQFPFEFKGLSFSSLREEVVRTLGPPISSGMGAQGPWDKFRIGDQTMHFLFRAGEEAILMVSIEPARSAEEA